MRALSLGKTIGIKDMEFNNVETGGDYDLEYSERNKSNETKKEIK